MSNSVVSGRGVGGGRAVWTMVAKSAVLGLVLLAAGCTGTRGSLTEPSATEPKQDKSLVEAVEFEDKPLWSLSAGNDTAGEDSGLEELSYAELANDAVVYVGSDPESRDSSMVVAELDSGEKRWDTTEDEQIGDSPITPDLQVDDPQLIDDGKTVIVAYIEPLGSGDGAEERGVAALSVANGKLLWNVTVDSNEGYGSHFNLTDATDTQVLTEVWTTTEEDGEDKIDSHRTAVIDVGKRDIAWDKDGVEPQGFANDTIVTERPEVPYPVGESADQSTVIGYDSAKGEKLWETDGDKNSTVAGIAADITAVKVANDITVLDNATGKNLGDKSIGVDRCRSHENLLACDSDDKLGDAAFATITAANGSAEITSKREFGNLIVHGVFEGRIFLGGNGPDSDQLILDAAGNTLAKKTPGLLADINGDHAIFADRWWSSFDNTIHVYRVE
ncbi:MAG: hypothetical protein ACRD0P_06300 [Stackebrandtia sp.]